MTQPAGQGRVGLKIADLGSCISVTGTDTTRVSFEMQTLPYRAPEVISLLGGGGALDKHTNSQRACCCTASIDAGVGDLPQAAALMCKGTINIHVSFQVQMLPHWFQRWGLHKRMPLIVHGTEPCPAFLRGPARPGTLLVVKTGTRAAHVWTLLPCQQCW